MKKVFEIFLAFCFMTIAITTAVETVSNPYPRHKETREERRRRGV